MVKWGNDVIYNKIEQGLYGIPDDCYQREACEIRICKYLEISNDRGEYIMNCSTSRANQHAGKCVGGAWLPMRVSKKGMWEGLEAKFGDVAALK